MAKSLRKRVRHRQKRQQRKRALARQRGGSPYQRIGVSGDVVACYINRNWRVEGQACIYLLRRVLGAGHAMGAYLVDTWCVGLKDAWGRLDIDYNEFSESVHDRVGSEVDLVRVDLDTARRLVGAGIRFADQNGFRLPPRYERWVALLGDIGDWSTADLSGFSVDGKLRYVGSMEDLKRRLVGCTVEEFLAREDVEFVLGDDDFTLLDDTTQALEETIGDLRCRGLNAVRQWCFANGMAPHSRLADAWDMMVQSILQDEPPDEDEEELDEQLPDSTAVNIARLVGLEDPQGQVGLRQAFEQVRVFMQQFESPDELGESLGFERTEPDED